MNSDSVVFWKDDKCVFLEMSFQTENTEALAEAKLIGCLCVDTRFGADDHDRYGMFSGAPYWTPVPLSEFPKEFKLALVIMGVL